MGEIAVNRPRIQTVTASDRRSALQLVFARLPRPQRDIAVAEAIRAIRDGGPIRHDVIAAWHGEQMAGATWLEIRPGRVASVWPPGLIEGADDSIATALLGDALRHALDAGAVVIQSLISDPAAREAKWLSDTGFQHTTDVLCMDCEPNRSPRQTPGSKLEFESYSDANLLRWKTVLQASYENSRDCPHMQMVRSIDDVLASYRAAGRSDASHWVLARYENQDVGCVIMTEHQQQDWELAYLGVVPEVRGRGFGLALVRHAQWLAAEGGATNLTLAVDVKNAPAIAVYEAAGFAAQQPHSVFSYIAKTTGSASPAS